MPAGVIEREHISTAAAAATAAVLLDKDVSIMKLFFLGRQSRTKTKADFLCESVFMTALCNRAGHYIFAMWFLLSIFFFPRLISAVADWMSVIPPHMVRPSCEFRMQV